MNSFEQKRRHTVVEQLAADTELVIESLADQTRKLIGDERTHRLKLADEQRSYVDGVIRDVRRVSDERWQATGEAQVKIIAMSEPLRRDLRGRLRWLLKGI